MPESYNKDAYKKVYQHPQWRQTAEAYEAGFAQNLQRAPVVQDAARGALVRLSNMLNAYYGMQDKRREFYEQTGRRDMSDFEKQKAIEEVASDMIGTTPKITRTLQEALLPDMAQTGAGAGWGQASNAYSAIYAKMNGAQSAEDMKLSLEQAQGASRTNEAALANVINGEGGLDAQMALLNNAVMNTGGPDEFLASRSRNLQNMLRGMNGGVAAEDMQKIGAHVNNQDLVADAGKTDYAGFDQLGRKSKSRSALEIFERSALKRGERKAEKEEAIRKAAAPPKRKRDAIRDAYASIRRRLGGTEKQKMQQQEAASAQGMLGSIGASAMTLRLLGAYRTLGAGKRDLLFFRLALIAWMVRGRRNSIYEILEASHSAGLKGSEDMSEAARMYTTLDPLTEQQARVYAPENRFPHETIFVLMLNDVRDKREALMQRAQAQTNAQQANQTQAQANTQQANQARANRSGALFEGLRARQQRRNNTASDAHNYDAQELALNLYTSPAYVVMNAGARLEDEEETHALLRSNVKDGVYLNSTREEQGNEELMNAIYDTLQVSSRLSQDALLSRGTEEADPYLEAEQPIAQQVTNTGFIPHVMPGATHEGRAAYRGVTWRGGGVWPDLKAAKGSTFTTKSLTSTSQYATIAAGFYDRARGEKALIRYQLDGKGAVRINDMSQYKNEAEVLVPTGTTFRIENAIDDAYYRQGSFNQLNYFDKLPIEDQQQIQYQMQMEKANKQQYRGLGFWRKVRLVTLREIAGPGERQRQAQQKGRDKNRKKAQDLEKYRRQIGARQAGTGS
ncbi:MAG: hypothetical protein LUC98_12090 [Lachnospiraceae bacterium]|nr:hypothetical protein [Lachnospiraceae bacterium]